MERKTNLLGGRAEAGAGGGGGGPPGRRGGHPTETESGCRTGRETSGEEQANPGKIFTSVPLFMWYFGRHWQSMNLHCKLLDELLRVE
jgi:hypothetical protein